MYSCCCAAYKGFAHFVPCTEPECVDIERLESDCKMKLGFAADLEEAKMPVTQFTPLDVEPEKPTAGIPHSGKKCASELLF